MNFAAAPHVDETGGIEDDHGEVEFSARDEDGGGQVAMHERSRFERRAGRWFYLIGGVH